uniref:Putative secreted protein n=1 Tax=Anopheles marajoara TaxID=58244 RepID=A0A2M4CAV3_9DIPT
MMKYATGISLYAAAATAAASRFANLSDVLAIHRRARQTTQTLTRQDRTGQDRQDNKQQPPNMHTNSLPTLRSLADDDDDDDQF